MENYADAASLQRFVAAQAPCYETALAELRAGRKATHWMWFIFPQIAGLGQSAMARRYAIADIEEARAYWRHETLGPRLDECIGALLPWRQKRSADTIFGKTDAMKLRSSMTLFERAEPGCSGPREILDGFYAGMKDQATLSILAQPS